MPSWPAGRLVSPTRSRRNEMVVDGGNPFGASTAVQADGSSGSATAGLTAGGNVEVYETLAM